MTQANKRRAYLYQRYSSISQDGNSSLYRQTESQQAWLARHPEIETDEGPDRFRFIDKGVSGFRGKNVNKGTLGNLLREIEQGKIEPGSLILVEHFSRLTRQNITEAESILRKIWEHGITLVTTRDGSEYPPEAANNMLQRMRLLVEIQLAFSDSSWRSEKAKASHAKKRADAAKGLNPRIRKPFWLDTNGRLNGHADAVKDIFAWYLAGDGQVTIVKKLTKKYPLSTPVQKLSPPTVIRWLTSPIAIGVWRGNYVYEPVVSEDVYYQVQNIHRNKLYKNVKPDRKWALSGLIQCASCGGGTSIQQTQNSMPVIRCSNRQRIGPERSGCKNPTTFPYALVDHFFNFHLLHLLENRLTAAELNEQQSQEYNKLKNDLATEQQKYDLLQSKYVDAAIDSNFEVLVDLMQQTKTKINEVRERLKILESSKPTVSPYEISRRVRAISKDRHQLNLVLQQANFKIIWDDKTISYENYSLVYLGYSRKFGRYMYLVNGEASMLPASPDMINGMLMEQPASSPEIHAQQEAFADLYDKAVQQHKETGELTMADLGQLLRKLKK